MDNKMTKVINAAKENGAELDDIAIENLQTPTQMRSYQEIDDLFESLTDERPIEAIQRRAVVNVIDDCMHNCADDNVETTQLIDKNRDAILEIAADAMYDAESDFNSGIVYNAIEETTGILPDQYGKVYPWNLAPDEYDDEDDDNDDEDLSVPDEEDE